MAAGMDSRSTIALESFGIVCVCGLMALRIWIQRGRRMTVCGVTYAVCIWVAFVCYLYITSIDVQSSVKQIRLGLDKPGTSEKALNVVMLNAKFLKMNFAGGVCYTCFLWSIKGSFIALYFENSARLVRKVRIALYAVTGFIVITFVANIFEKFFWCRPLKRNWSTGPDKCTYIITLPVNTSTTFFNITTDIALLALFVVIIHSLNLKHRELIAAVFIGFVGTCTVLAATLRYAIAYKAFVKSNMAASYSNTKIMLLWTNIEMGLVMLAVTLPSFRVFLRKRSPGVSSSGYSSQYRSRPDDNFQAMIGDCSATEFEHVNRPGGDQRGHHDVSSLGSSSLQMSSHSSIQNLCSPPSSVDLGRAA